MKLYIKERVFSWTDNFTVYDEYGNEKYFIKGEAFSVGKRLHILDYTGVEQAFIKQKVFSFLPKYFIFKGNVAVADVVKKFTFFRHEYVVNGPAWSIHGDVFDHNYDIVKDGKLIASVRRAWFTFGDAYEIGFADGVDELVALAVVLVIDACNDIEDGTY
jgi:uncharacterized protein YxjI